MKKRKTKKKITISKAVKKTAIERPGEHQKKRLPRHSTGKRFFESIQQSKEGDLDQVNFDRSPFEKLKDGLKEVIRLKSQGDYLNIDFDAEVDKL